MKLFGYVELDKNESSNELDFVATHHNGWFEVIGAIAFTIFGSLAFCKTRSWFWLFFVVIGIPQLIRLLTKPTETTRLSVTIDLIAAEGYFGSYGSGTRTYKPSDIKSLRYAQGGEDQPQGLYVTRGTFTYDCIIPYLTEEQANDIINAIYKQFPSIDIRDSQPYSILYGANSEPISLGLSTPPKNSNKS